MVFRVRAEFECWLNNWININKLVSLTKCHFAHLYNGDAISTAPPGLM